MGTATGCWGIIYLTSAVVGSDWFSWKELLHPVSMDSQVIIQLRGIVQPWVRVCVCQGQV